MLNYRRKCHTEEKYIAEVLGKTRCSLLIRENSTMAKSLRSELFINRFAIKFQTTRINEYRKMVFHV